MAVTTQMLSALQRQLHHQHRNCHQKVVSQMGLYYGQPLLLMILHDELALSQAELARHMNITQASVAVSIKRMEKNGLVTKMMNPQDLRYNTIRLTDKGMKLAVQCRSAMDRIDEELYVGFSAEEREQLADFYRRMCQNLESFSHLQKGEMLREEMDEIC